MTSKKFKILIGDDTAELGMSWARVLMSRGMYVVTRARNGKVLLDAVRGEHFDAIVMEAKMPEMDAVTFLGEMRDVLGNSSNLPMTIVVAGYDLPQTEREIMQAGANYYMVKPFEPSVLSQRIENLLENASVNQPPQNIYVPTPAMDLRNVSYNIHEEVPDSIEYVVTDIIHQIGIPAHIKGYHYLRTAILLSVEDPEMINCVTKLLYPTVAKQYSTTPSRVERAIRHAIEIAWDRGNVDTLNSFFGYTIHTSKGKPTNSEFVALIADKLKLKYKGLQRHNPNTDTLTKVY